MPEGLSMAQWVPNGSKFHGRIPKYGDKMWYNMNYGPASKRMGCQHHLRKHSSTRQGGLWQFSTTGRTGGRTVRPFSGFTGRAKTAPLSVPSSDQISGPHLTQYL